MLTYFYILQNLMPQRDIALPTETHKIQVQIEKMKFPNSSRFPSLIVIFNTYDTCFGS